MGGLLGVLPEFRRASRSAACTWPSASRCCSTAMLDQVHADWRDGPLDENARPAWFGDAVDAVAAEIMRRINAAAAVTPVNLLRSRCSRRRGRRCSKPTSSASCSYTSTC